MAASTGVLTVCHKNVTGSSIVKLVKIDMTAAGSDGYALTPGLIGMTRIEKVRFVGQESNSHFWRYIADSAAGVLAGSGKVFALSGTATVDTGDVGVVWFEVEGV